MKIENIEIISPQDNKRAYFEEYRSNDKIYYVFVSGKYQSLAKQIVQEKREILDAEQYFVLYQKGINDFKAKYQLKNSKEYSGKEHEIIKGFGQICITKNGEISVFSAGSIQFLLFNPSNKEIIKGDAQWSDSQEIILCSMEGTAIINSIRDLYFNNSTQDFHAKIQQFPYSFYVLKIQETSALSVPDIGLASKFIEPLNEESIELKKQKISPKIIISTLLLVLLIIGLGGWYFFNPASSNIISAIDSSQIKPNPQSISKIKFDEYLANPDSVQMLVSASNSIQNMEGISNELKERINKEVDFKNTELLTKAQKDYQQAEIYLQNGDDNKALVFYKESEKKLIMAKRLKPNEPIEIDKVLQKINLIKGIEF
jgi:hypothetical protein